MQAPSSCHQDAQPQERDTPWEVFHQRFSQFQYEAAAGPRDAFCKLWELCSQWLKPQTRSVEQILALFVTEKFLQILPADTESSTMLSLETRERLFTLIEGLQRDNGEAENTINIGDMILEELVPMGPLATPSNGHMRPPAPQLMEPAQECPEIPLAEPEEIIIDDDDDKCPYFLNIEFPLDDEYRVLDPPGEEPPEELLTVFEEPEEDQKLAGNQNQWEMPGTSRQVRETRSTGVQTQAPPPVQKAFSNELLGLCSAHRQQHNNHLQILTGMVAQEDPENRAGTSRGSNLYGRQFVSQEESTHESAMSGSSSTQAATGSETEANNFDQEREKCRLCKRDFMYTLGLVESVKAQVVLKYQCSLCGKAFKGKSRVTAHQVTHTNERPFLCQHCEKSYKHKSSLRRHLKIHTRVNGYNQSQGSQGPAPHANQ